MVNWLKVTLGQAISSGLNIREAVKIIKIVASVTKTMGGEGVEGRERVPEIMLKIRPNLLTIKVSQLQTDLMCSFTTFHIKVRHW